MLSLGSGCIWYLWSAPLTSIQQAKVAYQQDWKIWPNPSLLGGWSNAHPFIIANWSANFLVIPPAPTVNCSLDAFCPAGQLTMPVGDSSSPIMHNNVCTSFRFCGVFLIGLPLGYLLRSISGQRKNMHGFFLKKKRMPTFPVQVLHHFEFMPATYEDACSPKPHQQRILSN